MVEALFSLFMTHLCIPSLISPPCRSNGSLCDLATFHICSRRLDICLRIFSLCLFRLFVTSFTNKHYITFLYEKYLFLFHDTAHLLFEKPNYFFMVEALFTLFMTHLCIQTTLPLFEIAPPADATDLSPHHFKVTSIFGDIV